MKVLNVIRSVLAWIMVVIAVCMMIFTVVSVLTFDRADRNLFGYKAFIVLSDSMSKTDFDAGDLVLVKEVDPSTLKEGDIIAYSSQNEENYGATVTHKIRRLTTDANGNPGFVTYGTTTDTDDETVVTYPFVLGKYQKHIPKVGTFFRGLCRADIDARANVLGAREGFGYAFDKRLVAGGKALLNERRVAADEVDSTGEAPRPLPIGVAALSAFASNWGWRRVSRFLGSIIRTASSSVLIPSSTRSQAILRAA